MGMGVSCRHLTKHSVLVHGCDLTGDITAAVADGSAEGEQAQPSFLLAVMQGSCCFDAGSGTGLPWGCPCRLQSLGGAGLGWAGLVGAPGRTDGQSARHGQHTLHAATN